MDQPTINLLAVVVAAAASMVFGALWHGPLFGRLWMKLAKVTELKGAARGYGLNALTTLVMSYILAHFMAYAQATTVLAGIQTAFWLWLGFIATVTLGPVLWEGKPLKLYLFNNAYNLLGLAVMGAIHALMG